MNIKTCSRILLASRILLGLIFLVSGIGKVFEREDAKYLIELIATEIYWLIEIGNKLIFLITVLELFIALFLLSGKQLLTGLIGSLSMLVFFTIILLYFWFTNLAIESCGCFGSFDFLNSHQATILKNLTLMLVNIIALHCFFESRKKTRF